MHFSLMDILLSDGTARAVCWTLVHSLWEGLLVALLAGLIILATHRRSAALRYNLLAADLLLFVLIAGATFFYETSQDGRLPAADMTKTGVGMTGSGAHRRDHSGADNSAAGAIRTPNGPAGTISDNAIPLQRASDYLNTHAIVVTLIWLACLSGQMLRLTLGLYQVRRLRRNSIPPPDPDWNERLSVLARRLGIKRTVTLLQSALVKAPAALGFLKPSILVPMGMLANLPPDQVETILLHELAHIRRGDYAANLLLHLTEAIFFFNPGIRWVATLIRQEREACCDDIVLAGVPDKNSYFEALVAFKQWVIDGSFAESRSYTLQLGGGKTDLLWRIRRMLDRENKELQIMEKAILSFGLMALVIVSLISMKERDGGQPAKEKVGGQPSGETIRAKVQAAVQYEVQHTARSAVQHRVKAELQHATRNAVQANNAVQASNARQAEATSPIKVPADTVPKEQSSPSPVQTRTFPSFTSHSDSDDGHSTHTADATDDQGDHYELRMINGQVTEFKVNGQLVATEDYGKYADFFAADEERRRPHLRHLRHLAPQQSALAFRRSLQEMRRAMPASPAAPAAPGAPERGEGYHGTEQYHEAIRRYEEAARRYEEARRRYEQAQRLYEERRRKSEASLAEPLSPASPVSPVRPFAPDARPSQPTHSAPTLSNPLIYSKHPSPVVQKIVAELIESKLIDRVDEFSISLDTNGMTINDVRQPDEIFAKFKTKYLRHANDHIIYSQYYHPNGSGSHCEVKIDDTTPD